MIRRVGSDLPDGGLTVANLGLRFGLAPCALAALEYWGFQAGGGALVRLGLGVGGPLVVAVAWGAVLAPKAPVDAPPPVRLGVEVAVFGLAVAGLASTGHPALAGALGAAWVVNRVLIAVTRPEVGAPPR